MMPLSFADIEQDNIIRRIGGSMFAGYGNVFGFIIGLLVVAFGVYMLVRKQREN
ncbi:MAG: hypothetical protein J5768_05985 [Spirochaetales bacterium]|nr:hypothetical protein [Spirochaetales bacterium]